MTPGPSIPSSVDDYVAGCPHEVREILEQIRTTVRRAVPGAEETISYRIPTFTLRGKYLIYVAAHKNHIGVYPAPIANPEFSEELATYASGKGTAKFPLNEPLPLELIARIVKFRANEIMNTTASKG